ncbi:sensor histidine kinase [Chitinophaga varians]|uniref:sensor histidine kinase n=1 Tax=Chitinophaga varians TaxID=2202339 RepID=UPI00165F1F95|nr:sensor histidine kinase [Chitinophaga varians]MBC9915595.1 sensor histidine kinase [Chitinophaga varians]
MQEKSLQQGRSRFPAVYEWSVIFLYVCMYKYSELLGYYKFPHIPGNDLPYPQLILFSLLLTAYVVIYYRWLMPWLLRKKMYGWVLPAVIVCFGYLGKYDALLVNKLFAWLSTDPVLSRGFEAEYRHQLLGIRWPFAAVHMEWLFTDFAVFSSILFVRETFEKEHHRRQVQEANMQLQLDALKGQLNPHFLFNTLNSLYAMSLKQPEKTPGQILKLAEMMRYVLYEAPGQLISLEKEVVFLQQYLDMEQQKYPAAQLRMHVDTDSAHYRLAPLLLLPLMENVFKHGALCVEDNGYASIIIRAQRGKLSCTVENDVVPGMPVQRSGIGLANVRRRLELYYPGRHELKLESAEGLYRASLHIDME